MNWGKGITIAMIAFIGFIIALTSIMMSKQVDLQSEDYYQQEIAYDEKISALNNAGDLDKKVEIQMINEHIIVKIPDTDYRDVRVEFKRPNDKKLDKSFDIVGTQNFMINRSEFEAGKYNLDISYLKGEKICLQQQSLFIK